MNNDESATMGVAGRAERLSELQEKQINTPMKNTEGKVAFITGGDSGIGFGIARRFLDAGMKVVITYHTQKHLDDTMTALRDATTRVHAIRLDVADRAAMHAAAEETSRVFGRVHVLVNNAGVWPTISLCNATYDDWDWCMSVNVTGVFNGIREFLPRIQSHGDGGHIVTTASIGGLTTPRLWGVYSTSKFASVGMMEALSSELTGSNVGVSVFCPGPVSSNIQSSDRNRPPRFSLVGRPDDSQRRLMESVKMSFLAATLAAGETQPMMDPLEAGERVLNGVRNNDLYILSHPEYEQAIRDRSDALIASIPESERVCEARIMIARAARNPMYVEAISRKQTPSTR